MDVIERGDPHGATIALTAEGEHRPPFTVVALGPSEPGLTPLDYARKVGPQPDAIVVGHWLAGFTIPHIEARARVYLAALPPLERSEVKKAFVESFGGAARDSGGRSYWPDAKTAAARRYPDCSRAQSDWAFPQLRHQARLEPIPAPLGTGDVVIATLQDAAIVPDWQIRTARAHGARVIELGAGHSPFLTQPAELADILSTRLSGFRNPCNPARP